MKIDKLDGAQQAAREYRKAVVNRESAFAAEWMKISVGTDRAVMGDTIGPIHPTLTSGSYAELASKVRAAVIDYYNFRVAICEQRLKEIGVEVE